MHVVCLVSRCNDVVPSEEHWNLGEHYGPGPPGKRNMGAGLGNDVFAWYSCKSSCCNGSLIISFFFCSSREHDEAVKSREKMKTVIKYLWSQVRG